MTTKFDIFNHLIETEILTASLENNYQVIKGEHSGLITKIPDPAYNCLVLGSLDSTLIEELKAQNIPFICFPKEAIESEFEDFVKNHGLVKGDDVMANEFTNMQDWTYQPNPKIEIRKITDLDGLKIFSKIAGSSFGHSENFPFEFLHLVINHPDFHFFVASINGVDAGCGIATLTNKKAGLYWGGVLEEHRKQGIGSELTKYRMNFVKNLGFDSICAQNMTPSQGYYSKIGFKPKGSLPLYLYAGS